jgi:Flp pilus assembly protein TadB
MTATPQVHPVHADRPDHQEKTTAELVRDLTEQVSRLARTEVTLAMREVKGKAKHAGLGAAIAGAGGLFAFFGGAVLIAAFVLLLALVVPAWAAALIVAGALFVIAGIAVLIARAQLKRGAPMPSPALESAKEDINVVKEARKR